MNFSNNNSRYVFIEKKHLIFSTARGAATEKALSPIRRVRGTTRSPDDEARSADRAGTSAAGVSKSDMFIQLRDEGNEKQQQ